MVDDKIKILVQDLMKLRDEINDIKKDKRKMERDIPEELKELEKASKELKMQVKDGKEKFEAELTADSHYKQLREMIVEKEEKIAETKVKLWTEITQIPQQRDLNMDITLEDARFIKLQTEHDIRVYLNGKEEKKA